MYIGNGVRALKSERCGGAAANVILRKRGNKETCCWPSLPPAALSYLLVRPRSQKAREPTEPGEGVGSKKLGKAGWKEGL